MRKDPMGTVNISQNHKSLKTIWTNTILQRRVILINNINASQTSLNQKHSIMGVFQIWNVAQMVDQTKMVVHSELSLDPEKSGSSTNLPMPHTYAHNKAPPSYKAFTLFHTWDTRAPCQDPSEAAYLDTGIRAITSIFPSEPQSQKPLPTTCPHSSIFLV